MRALKLTEITNKLTKHMLQHFCRLFIRRSDSMRVDVRCRRRLRMPCSITHRLQRNPCCKQERDVRMPQGVNRDLWQIGPRDEIVEPTRDAIRVNRCSVILSKNPVAINPSITHSDSLFALPFAVLL